jgi:uncharacterized paraquat-inducible protein A
MMQLTPNSSPLHGKIFKYNSSLPVKDYVECVACGATFELTELATGKISGHSCPSCKTTPSEFWSDKPQESM